MEIEIRVGRLWQSDEDALIARVKQVVSGDPHGPFVQETGYRYRLDSGNDWWAELRGDLLVIANRYARPRSGSGRGMDGLKMFLEWDLN